MKTKIAMLLLLMQPMILLSQIVHTVSFKDIQFTDSKINTNYLEIVDDELINNNEQEGVPSLPSKIIHLSIPAGSKIVSVTMSNPIIKTRLLSKKILPCQGKTPIKEMSDKEFIQPLNAIYDNGSFYPAEQIRIVHIDYFDYTNQIVSLEVTPFKYDAKNNQLLFYSSFDIQIKLEKEQVSSNNLAKINRNRTVEEQKKLNTILETMVDNPEDIKYNDTPMEGFISDASVSKVSAAISQELSYEYVVITSNALAPAFNRFVAWKKRKGINIGIVTMEYIRSQYSGDLISGIYDDAGKLRQFLFNAYKNGLKYALLGGDQNTVPIRKGSSLNNPSPEKIELNVIPTDLYFADFNGNWNADGDSFYGEPNDDKPDYAAEISVGRILSSTPQHIENWTEKLICYESNPGNGDFAYLKKAFYTQADQMQNNNWASTIKATFSMFTTNTIFEETYNGVKNDYSTGLPQFPTGADVINEFNKNYGLVSFMGHGSPCNVAVATVNWNNDNYPKNRVYTSSVVHPEYIFAGSCSVEEMNNGMYPNIYYSISCETMPYDDALSWHVGHDHLGNYYTINYKSGSVAYLGNTRDGLINSSRDLFVLFGEEINKGNYKVGVAEESSLQKTSDLYLKYSHNLLGCPEMEMWTDIPTRFNSASVSESGNNITVNTGGVAGATICVMSAMDNGLSYFDKRENVSSATFTNVDKYYLVTITKHNYIPYLKNPDNLYFQNETINSDKYIYGVNFYAGNNVTTSKPTGAVIVKSGSNVVFDADNEVYLDGGFSVELGGRFEAR